jgi:hypothetical protein
VDGTGGGIHPEVRQLDRELRWYGGMARAIMDDVVAGGPPAAVFPAVTRFIARIHEFTDLVGQTAKFVSTRREDLASLDVCPWRQRACMPIGRHQPRDGGAPIAYRV